MPFAQLKLIRTLMATLYWQRERGIRPNYVYIQWVLCCLGVYSIWCYSIFRIVFVLHASALLIWNNWFLLPCAFANKLLRSERRFNLLGVTWMTIACWAWGLASKCLFEEVSFLSMKVLGGALQWQAPSLLRWVWWANLFWYMSFVCAAQMKKAAVITRTSCCLNIV